jgi:alkanesulfonate monooxygenase SsuD/methylene tetrahydromethanopterin reductase-like flavin-dependent oxidoreductase (luciferase family)
MRKRDRRAGTAASHRGHHFTLENARLYSRPDTPPPLLPGGGGPRTADLPGSLGDGMIGTDPDPDLTARSRRWPSS